MAPPSTLYRFRISVPKNSSSIDVRLALHPSETPIYLVTRLLAYILNYQDGLELTQGLSDPSVPAIRLLGNHGEIQKWIDIGNPSPQRLHKSAKASSSVSVYTYKDVELLKKSVQTEKIYNVEKIQLFAIDPDFLESLADALERDNRWEFSQDGEELTISTPDETYIGTIVKHALTSKK